MEKDCVRVEIADRIALVTLDNPPVNALSADVRTRLREVFSELNDSKEVLVVLLTGAGDKAFMAGADIKQLATASASGTAERLALTKATFDAIAQSPHPVIAAIEGLALGGGCELALACDLRIAGRESRFGLPEVRLGAMPGAGGTQRLPRVVGPSRAKELIFTGRMISAEEAWRIGLVDRLVEKGSAVAEARKLAEEIGERGPLAVRAAKKAINQSLVSPLEEGLQFEARLFTELAESADMHEGVTAFIEKRPPQFAGK